MAYKLTALFALFGVMLSLAVARAQQNAPFRYSQCPDPVTCCMVPAARMTQPVPGGTPTTVVESAVNLFGAHVSNLNTPLPTPPIPLVRAPQSAGTPNPRSTGTPSLFVDLTMGQAVTRGTDGGRYLQFFDTTHEPHPGTTPIGASSWFIPSGKDRDLDVGSGGGGSGWAFNDGIMACCSTDQNVFEPSDGCGFLIQYY